MDAKATKAIFQIGDSERTLYAMTEPDDEPPPIGPRLVSERSDAQIAAQEAQRNIKFAEIKLRSAVRELAANLLRIIANGGKDYELVQQITETLKTYQALRDL